MRNVKIILIVVLVLTLGVLLFACGKESETTLAQKANSEKVELNVAVMSDTHYLSYDLIGDYKYASFAGKVADSKTNELSNAIIKTAFDNVINAGYEALIITGDLCDDHATQNHEEMSALIKSVEDRGLKVFVVPGNHDVAPDGHIGYRYTADGKEKVENLQDTSQGIVESFKNYYKDFGYDEAVAVSGLSYVAKLKDGYRLLVIDNCSEDLSDTTFDFIESQLSEAKSAGDKVIAAYHKPINNIFGGITDTLGLNVHATTPGSEKLTELLAGKVEIALAGHNHANDAVTLKSSEGKTFTEVMTSSLSQCANCYREMKFTKNFVKSEVVQIKSVKEEYLPSYLSADDKAAVLSDFNGYSKGRIAYYGKSLVNGLNISQILKDVIFVTTPAPEGFDEVANGITDFINRPLYGENSYAEFFKSYGATFPVSDFKTLYDAVAAVGEHVFYGGESQKDGVALNVVKAAIKGVIAYVYSSDLFDRLEDIGGNISNRTEKVKGFCEDLLISGKLDLYGSGIVNSVLKFEKINEELSDNLVIRSMLGIPSSLKYKTQAEFSKTVSSLISVADGIETFKSLNLAKYFESETAGESTTYTGTVYWDKVVDEVLLGKILYSFIEDSDMPDCNFVVRPSDCKWEKIN